MALQTRTANQSKKLFFESSRESSHGKGGIARSPLVRPGITLPDATSSRTSAAADSFANRNAS